MSKIEEGLAEYSSVVPLYSTAFWVAWITIIYSGDCIVLPLGDAYATTATRSSSQPCFWVSPWCFLPYLSDG